MSFAENLKRYREAARLSQVELAQRCGVNDRTVSNWERGLAYPKINTVPLISKALGVPVSSLVTEEASFVMDADEKYGELGVQQAQNIIEQTRALFYGGGATDADKDKVFRVITEMYFDAKEKQKPGSGD